MADDGARQGRLVRPRRILSVGVTGHRPSRLVGCDMAALDRSIAALIDAIAAAARVGSPRDLRMISPLAEGADSMLADAATARGWRLEVVLPFLSEDYANDFEVGAVRDDHLKRLAGAAAVFELPGLRGEAEEPISYERAGRVMVAQSDIIIAIWDGGPVRGRGGAAQIVAEAVYDGVPVIQLDPRSPGPPQLLWDGLVEIDLGQQTVETVARGDLSHLDRLIGELLADAAVGQPDRRHFFDRSAGWRMPGLAYPALLAMARVRTMRGSDFRMRPPLRPDCSELTNCRGDARQRQRLADLLVPRFIRADQAATHSAAMLRSGYVRNFSLAAFAVAVSMLGLLLPHGFKAVLLFTEFATIVTILGGTHIGRRAGWHGHWLEHRALAERLRCLAITVQLGDLDLRDRIGETAPWASAMATATARELGLPHAAADEPYLLAVRDALCELIDGQRSYLKVEAQRMHRLEHRLHLTGTGLFMITAFSCVALLITHGVMGIEAPQRVLTLVTAMSALFPAIGAAIYGIRMQGDFAGVAERSTVLDQHLTVLRSVIDEDDLSFETLSRRARRAADLLTGDVARWLSNASVRPLVLPG